MAGDSPLDAALARAEVVLEGFEQLGPILSPSDAEAKDYLALCIGAAKALRALPVEFDDPLFHSRGQDVVLNYRLTVGELRIMHEALAAFVAAFPEGGPDDE